MKISAKPEGACKLNIALVAGDFPVRSQTFIVQHALGLARRGHHVTVYARSIGPGIHPDEVDRLRRHMEIVWSDSSVKTSQFVSITSLLKRIFVEHGELTLVDRLNLLRILFIHNGQGRTRALNSVIPLVGKKFDIIHVHFGVYALPVYHLKKCGLLVGKLVVTWHGFDANYLPKKYGDRMYKNIFCNDVYHTVGSVFMKKRLKSLGANPLQLYLVPMGVDTDVFVPSETRNICDKPINLISVGRLVEVKGHIYLLKAVIELIEDGIPIKLTIIGEGVLRSQLERLIRSSAMDDYITLEGGRDAEYVRKAMQEAHVFALTGVEAVNGMVEAQGVVFAEAQSCGLPVIGARTGGVPEGILQMKSGILCEPGETNEIKKAIKFFIDNPESIEEFGKAGRVFVKENFSIDVMLSRFELVYEAAVHRAPAA